MQKQTWAQKLSRRQPRVQAAQQISGTNPAAAEQRQLRKIQQETESITDRHVAEVLKITIM